LIYISQEQAAQVQYLLEQAMQGNHILFDSGTLKKILSKPAPKKSQKDEEAYPVEHHIEKLMTLKTLPEKRAYLERMDSITFEAVVRAYFNIVENTLFEVKKVTH
jgi:hypothetical protein